MSTVRGKASGAPRFRSLFLRRGRVPTLSLALVLLGALSSIVVAQDKSDSSEMEAPPPALRATPDMGPEDRPGWLGINGRHGIGISMLSKSGPAYKGGLREGDVIIMVDGEALVQPHALMSALNARRASDVLPLTVQRMGFEEPIDLAITLGPFPEDVWQKRIETWRSWTEEYEQAQASRRAAAPQPVAVPIVGPPRAPNAPEVVYTHVGEQERAFLGVRTLPLGKGLSAYFKLPKNQGVLVEHVFDDSGAAAAGLEAGDILLKVAEEIVVDMTTLGGIVRTLQPGQEVRIVFVRDGKTVKAPLVLGARKKDIWATTVSPTQDVAVQVQRQLRATQRTEIEEHLRSLKREIKRLNRDLERLDDEAP
jgi:S1-C subfamily serine protease